MAFRARLNRRKDPELARLNRELSQARHRLIEAYGERHNADELDEAEQRLAVARQQVKRLEGQVKAAKQAVKD